MRLMCRIAVPVLAVALAAVTAESSSAPESPQTRVLQNVDFEQRLDHPVPLDGTFLDDRGRRVSLAHCLRDRPAALVLAYYRCPSLCNQVLNGVARSLQAIDLEPGQDFEVIVVSIDPADTVELASAKKKAVVRAFDHNSGGAGWHFLVSDPPFATDSRTAPRVPPRVDPDVAALCESVGFRYQYDSLTGQFAHASGLVLLTPSGRTSRYFYGIDYPTRDLRLGLVDASQGRIGTAVDQLLLYCFHYDPLTGRYGLAIMRLVRGAAVVTVLGLGAFIGLALRRERRSRESLRGGDPHVMRHPGST